MRKGARKAGRLKWTDMSADGMCFLFHVSSMTGLIIIINLTTECATSFHLLQGRQLRLKYINYPQIHSWDLNSTISNFKASGVWSLVLKVALGWDTTIIWEPVRNAHFWAPPKSTESGILGVRPSILCLSKPCRQFWCSKFQVSIRESVCLFVFPKRDVCVGGYWGIKSWKIVSEWYLRYCYTQTRRKTRLERVRHKVPWSQSKAT